MNDITIGNLREREASLLASLADLWEASVRATHDFLQESDITGLRGEVGRALRNIETLLVLRWNNALCGFAGVENTRLEMLFFSPESRGRGLGRHLVAHVVQQYGVREVDVNEDNTRALGFYRRLGFAVAARSPLDGAGRPFPLLHLRLPEEAAAALKAVSQ